ncbi:MAG: hypothetical protein ACLQDY_22320 [Streptosporangiaceae bacterium]
MRFNLKSLAAAAGTLALVAVPAAASASAHPHAVRNATPACGGQCTDMSNLYLGTDFITHANGHGKVVSLARASNGSQQEDFTFEPVGVVADFCGTLLPSTSVPCLDYSSAPAYEMDYSPYGNDSGYCAGTIGTPYQGHPVKLVACGESQGSLLIGEDNPENAGGSTYISLISGATTSFSHPYVFQVRTGRTSPRHQLELERQNTLTGSVARDTQMFTFVSGPAA